MPPAGIPRRKTNRLWRWMTRGGLVLDERIGIPAWANDLVTDDQGLRVNPKYHTLDNVVDVLERKR